MVVALGFMVVALGIHDTSVAIDADASPRRQSPRISKGVRDESGVLVHKVDSPYQSATTEIRVLLPANLERDRRYPVVYLLPVEARNGQEYGDAITEVLGRELHNKHRAICVMPTFSQLPWYADHPTDLRVRQETHFVEIVLPFVEKTYPAVKQPDGRLLAGFSKSGWGALTLLLRHPDTFGKAAAWDAPLMMDAPGRFGSGPIFGSDENFTRYQLSQLFERQANQLKGTPRLAILGYGGFRDDHRRCHALLNQLDISHVYRDGPKRRHDWHSAWLPEAFEFLLPTNSTGGSPG